MIAGGSFSTPLADGADCTKRALKRFLAGRAMSTRCPRFRPFIRPGRPLPTSLADLPPVPGVPGRRGRLLRAFELSFTDWVDDVVSVLFVDPAASTEEGVFRGAGLRGGRWVVGDDSARLDRFEFVPGVRVSLADTGRDEVFAVRLDGPGALDGRLRMRASVAEDDPLAYVVRGRLGRPPDPGAAPLPVAPVGGAHRGPQGSAGRAGDAHADALSRRAAPPEPGSA